MSHLASQLGEATDAIRIAEVGLGHASQSPARHQFSARLHAMRARGFASKAEMQDCLTALGNAEHILGYVRRDEPAEWVSHFDEGSLAVEAALCLSELGDLTAAEQHARQVLAVRDGDRVRSRAFGQLTLAEVLLAAGQVDEAATLGHEVAAVAPSLASTRVKTRLDDLARALEPYNSLAAVRSFQASYAATHSPQVVPREESWPV
ncbi:hypothetical protein [Amycolatopsis taiwanensis]|uniref:Uncharacterized protein n=1 Tax=Amycolatopsis taiwanensis TaxID=342230 RepID=A0A9W6QUX4_9PSEU|nr:hypothetical protein [Amycolatopsis taiwanensis]GLY64188.1 hypothetical protein Atai01_08070 [Amycolatopsis taiwanensis]